MVAVATVAINDRQSPFAPRFYRPELDVLRLCAFLMVYGHHVFPRTLGAYHDILHWCGTNGCQAFSSASNALGFGLPVFFFLSAYLIATLLLIERRRFGSINLKAFYARRVLRIWPLYYFALAIGLADALVGGRSAPLAMFAYYAVFIGNFYFYSHPWAASPMTPLWSISVEEQFYLVFPLLLSFGGASNLIGVCLAAVAASLAFLLWAGHAHLAIDTTVWTHTMSQLLFFAVGAWCAALTVERRWVVGPAVRALLIVVCVGLFFAAARFTDAKHIGDATSGVSLAAGYALVAVGCVCLLLALLDVGLKFPGPLLYLGKISFGLYVFHETSLRLVGASLPRGTPAFFLLGLGLTVALAALSYRYIESPFLNLRRRFTLVENRRV